MGKCRDRRKAHATVRVRGTAEICLVGLLLMAAGLVLLFLCVPGWAWAALIGALLVAAGFWLLTLGRR